MFRFKRIAPRTNQGFTLLELLIVISLLTIFMGAVYESVIIGIRSADASYERETLRQQIANTLDILTREAALASNVDNAEDERFQFDADLDGDGTVENNLNYRLSNGNLERNVSSTTVILINNVTSLDFNYRDNTDSNMSTPVGSAPTRDTIRVMQITLTATNDNETISIASAAYLRNNN